MIYKLAKNSFGENIVILQNDNGSSTSFFADLDNTDYQAYLAWVAQGNEPEAAE